MDYIITRQVDRENILDTRAMCGTDCSTDHNMIRSKLALTLEKQRSRSRGSPNSKIDVTKLRNAGFRKEFQRKMDDTMDHLATDSLSVEDKWTTLKKVAYGTAEDSLGKPSRKHQDWFDYNDKELNHLLRARNQTKAKLMQTNTRGNCAKLISARSNLQKYTRQMKSRWWEEKAEALQAAADKNDMKEFYNGLREVYGPHYRGSNQLLASDEETILKEKNQTLNRIAEHFNQLLNIPRSADVSTLDSPMAKPIVPSLDTPPQMDEILKAIAATKDGKAPGVCGIPAEV